MVPGAGIEPARPCGRRILSPLRLPVPPPGQGQVSVGRGTHRDIDLPELVRAGVERDDARDTFADGATRRMEVGSLPHSPRNPLAGQGLSRTVTTCCPHCCPQMTAAVMRQR